MEKRDYINLDPSELALKVYWEIKEKENKEKKTMNNYKKENNYYKSKTRTMNSINLTKERKRCAGLMIKELRGALLLALKYARGENRDFIRVERYIREGLDKLAELDKIVK